MVNKKIVIIDDDAIFCFILEKQLPKNIVPFTKIFHKAKEALTYIVEQNLSETKFLIFLDLNMPLMNGFEFLDNVKAIKQTYDLKVVIVTSSINPEDEKKASSYSEVVNFLAKPIAELDLQKIINSF